MKVNFHRDFWLRRDERSEWVRDVGENEEEGRWHCWHWWHMGYLIGTAAKDFETGRWAVAIVFPTFDGKDVSFDSLADAKNYVRAVFVAWVLLSGVDANLLPMDAMMAGRWDAEKGDLTDKRFLS